VIPDLFQFEFKNWSISTIKGLTFGAVIFIFSTLSSALKKGRQLKEENLIFQNETLKNQINPHFLFNNLNTISSLISTKPELAEKFINKFSDIYRYILENIKKDKVSLKMEFDFISDYFELHKIRDEGKILLHIDQTDVEKYSIPPVSLQILIENAIKHNMATRERPLHISVVIENDHVIVRNDLQKMAHQFESTRIGLKNLKERIQLISDQPLIIEEDKDKFIVKIPLLP
jgi:LytS/YehU family sensor histidine kinase